MKRNAKIKNYIHKLRVENKMSQIEFAKKLKIDQSYVSKLENGTLRPCANVISGMRRKLGLDINLMIDKKRL